MTIQKQVNELTSLSSFADSNVIPVHDGNGLKKGTITQLATNLATKFSNPNLLINPNFAINQRDKSTYTGNASTKTYTVDRWYVLGVSCTVTVNSDGTVTVKNSGSSEATFAQISETTYSNVTASINVSSYSGTVKLFTNNASKQITASGISSVSDSGSVNTCGVKLASGASVTITYFKTEIGNYSTNFIIPSRAEEITKCFRYYQFFDQVLCVPLQDFRSNLATNNKFYQTTNCVFYTEMRVKPTIKYTTFSDGSDNVISDTVNFEYNNMYIDAIWLSKNYSYFSVKVKKLSIDAEIY